MAIAYESNLDLAISVQSLQVVLSVNCEYLLEKKTSREDLESAWRAWIRCVKSISVTSDVIRYFLRLSKQKEKYIKIHVTIGKHTVINTPKGDCSTQSVISPCFRLQLEAFAFLQGKFVKLLSYLTKNGVLL